MSDPDRDPPEPGRVVEAREAAGACETTGAAETAEFGDVMEAASVAAETGDPTDGIAEAVAWPIGIARPAFDVVAVARADAAVTGRKRVTGRTNRHRFVNGGPRPAQDRRRRWRGVGAR